MRAKRSHRIGSAFLEVALSFPVLLLLTVGGADFGRMYYSSSQLAKAAEAGAKYGASSPLASSDVAGITRAALDQVSGLKGVTATATQSCVCGGVDQSCAVSCGAKKHILVTVSASYTFNLMFPYPGIPSSIAMTRTAVERAQ
jgi:Flp pilus assembly protein TadG